MGSDQPTGTRVGLVGCGYEYCQGACAQHMMDLICRFGEPRRGHVATWGWRALR